MNKIIKSLIFLLTLFHSVSSLSTELIITTGGELGVYYAMGKALKDISEDKDLLFPLRVDDSKGSGENICRLMQGDSNFAIVQSDVLNGIVNGSALKGCDLKYNEKMNIVGISSLYPEYTQILVRKESGIRNIYQLSNRNVFLGEKTSGTRINSEAILNATGVDINEIHSIEGINSSTAIDRLLCKFNCNNNPIDAAFITTGEFKLLQKKNSDSLTMISFRNHVIKKIRNKYPDYRFTTLTDFYGYKYIVPYTRALLVSRLENKSTKINPGVIGEFIKRIDSQIEVEINKYGKDIDIFMGKGLAIEMSIPLHPEVVDYYKQSGYIQDNKYIIIFFSVLLVISLSSLISYIGVNWKFIAKIREMLHANNISTRPILYAPWNKLVNNWLAASLWGLITIMVFIIIVILETEDSYSRAHDVINNFSTMGLSELLTWMIVFMLSGYTQGIFPNHPIGKAFAVAIPMVFYIAALITIFRANFRINKNAEKRENGFLVPHLKNHIVICGWNSRVPEMVREITRTNSIKKGKKVVVLATFSDENPLSRYSFSPGFVHYCKGMSSDHSMLEKACISEAEKVIIVADENKIKNENFRGVLTAYAVSSNKPHDLDVIAELYHEENDLAFKSAGIDKLIPVGKLYERLISSATFNPGLSDIITSVLSFDGTQVADLICLSANKKIAALVVGKTFHSASIELRKENIMMISIYSDERKPKNGHDAYEMSFKKNSPYIVNPYKELDINYNISPKDKLIVIQKNPSGVRGENVGQGVSICGKKSVFDKKNEKILVIGQIESIENYISILNENHIQHKEIEVPTDISVFETQEKIVKNISGNIEEYRDITRTVIFSQRLASENFSSGVYQDDFVMSISLKVKNIFNEYGMDMHLVSEMRSKTNKELYYALGVAQPIPVNQLIELLETRMIFYNGIVSGLFIKLMDYSKCNIKSRLAKVGISTLPENTKGTLLDYSKNLTFDDIANELIKVKMQLIAVAPSDGRIIMNPTSKKEGNFTLTSQDSLFVIVPTHICE